MNIYRIIIGIHDPNHVAVEVSRNDGMYLQLNAEGRQVVDDIMRTMTDAAAKLLGASITEIQDHRPPVDNWDAVIDEGVDHI